MKKLFTILVALFLALSCTALAEESAQAAPSPDPFSGLWITERASIRVDWEEEGYRVHIEGSESAFTQMIWDYSCYYDEGDQTMVSVPFGICTENTYDDAGNLTLSEKVYEDGVAVFSLDEDGYMIWEDQTRHAGEGLRFEKTAEADPENWILKSLTENDWCFERAELEVLPLMNEESDCSFLVRILWADSASEGREWDYECLYSKDEYMLEAHHVKCMQYVIDENLSETLTPVYDRESTALFGLTADGRLKVMDPADMDLEGMEMESVPAAAEKGSAATEEQKAAMAQALESSNTDTPYVPLCVLAEEDGIICILCSADVDTPDGGSHYALVVFRIVDRNGELLWITELNEDLSSNG